jgi:hypothetical protein
MSPEDQPIDLPATAPTPKASRATPNADRKGALIALLVGGLIGLVSLLRGRT